MDSSCSRCGGMFGGKVSRKLKTDAAFDKGRDNCRVDWVWNNWNGFSARLDF